MRLRFLLYLHLLFVLIGLSDLYVVDILRDIKPNEISILQYDSRPLEDYWLASALWNKYYSDLHGHKFLYYNMKSECTYEYTKLASPWCKVKAMLQAHQQNPNTKLFLYLDSDAVIDSAFINISINVFVSSMQHRLKWEPDEVTLSCTWNYMN